MTRKDASQSLSGDARDYHLKKHASGGQGLSLWNPGSQILRGSAPPHLLRGPAREERFGYLPFFVVKKTFEEEQTMPPPFLLAPQGLKEKVAAYPLTRTIWLANIGAAGELLLKPVCQTRLY